MRIPTISVSKAQVPKPDERTLDISAARAFTLIEALIAVALLSAMTLLGMPMYRDVTARGHRVLVINALHEHLSVMAWQADGVVWGNAAVPHATRSGTPAGNEVAKARMSDAMASSGPLHGLYRFNRTRNRDGTTYIRATPIYGGAMQDDACGAYELGSNGVQRNVGTGGTYLPYPRQQACWRGHR